ncbi:MAG: phosphate transport system permease protein [Pseudonocardiales bacterium]|nr:phosphate transport system permease protein [Pseudonocardiales bacterium]
MPEQAAEPTPRPDPAGRGGSVGAQPAVSALQNAADLPIAAPLPGGSSMLAGRGGSKRRLGDRVFAGITSGAAAIVIVMVILIAVFLLLKAGPSITADKASFLTSTQWQVGHGGELRFGIAGLLYTTVLSSVFALLLAVPLAIGIALFITQYAPRRVARPIAHAIDLLAAIPSIIYGLWGIRTLAPHLTPVQHALSHIGLGIFDDQHVDTGTVFDAGVVLAIMILPIITAISRDVFDRTPIANKEAALALGATRWEMIRMAVLPYGRPGVISGAMLGLGRALGETIAVLLILSTVSGFSFSIFSGGSTFASKIVQGKGEFGNDPGPYIAAGLVLFVLTFIVNAIARSIVARRKDFT